MSTVTDFDYEEAALAPTLPPVPEPEPAIIRALPEVCDALWLPPCPSCSWVAFWRRAALDRLEWPGFHLARHTTNRYGSNYYILNGCVHAYDLGAKFGPTRNRLKLAIAWRRHAAELLAGLFNAKFTDTQRAEYNSRLGHPSMRTA